MMKQVTISAMALALVLGAGGLEPETKGAMAIDGVLVVRMKPAPQPEAQQQKPQEQPKREPAREQATRGAPPVANPR